MLVVKVDGLHFGGEGFVDLIHLQVRVFEAGVVLVEVQLVVDILQVARIILLVVGHLDLRELRLVLEPLHVLEIELVALVLKFGITFDFELVV